MLRTNLSALLDLLQLSYWTVRTGSSFAIDPQGGVTKDISSSIELDELPSLSLQFTDTGPAKLNLTRIKDVLTTFGTLVLGKQRVRIHNVPESLSEYVADIKTIMAPPGVKLEEKA